MFVRAFAILVLVGLALPPAAAAPYVANGLQLEDLTWTELKSRVGGGATTILVPIGGTEQSGPGIALGKHNARVRVLANQIALEVGNTLVAPVIAYVPEGDIDPPTSHMRFPGTLSLSHAAFQETLIDAARSLRAAGFRDIVFLGDHGGYQSDLTHAADALNKEWAKSPARAHALPEYYGATQIAYVAALEKQGYTKAEIGVHAGLADTSLALALTPSLVHREKLTARESDGVQGDPKRASAELGQLGVNAIVDASVAAIRKARMR